VGFYHQSGYQLLSTLFHLGRCCDSLSRLQCNCRQWCGSFWLSPSYCLYGLFFTVIITESIPQSNLVFPRMLNGGLCMYRMDTSVLCHSFHKSFNTHSSHLCYNGRLLCCEASLSIVFQRLSTSWVLGRDTVSLCFEDSSLFKSTLVSSLQ
jgi:hypothetical protein